MDHRIIEESELVERYLLGRATPEEREEFEDHFLDCPECLERLELTRRLQAGLARVAVEENARAATVRQLGAMAVLARLASRRAGLLLTAVLVVALAPAGLMWRQVAQLDRDLEETRGALAAARQPSRPSTAPPPAETAGELAAARQALAAEQARREQERQEEDRERQRLAAELAAARRPQPNTPLVSLSPERSAGERGEPATRITLPPSSAWVVLALEPGPLDQPGPFRATLQREGRQVWQGGGLEPGAEGTVVISFHASDLPPGDYDLELATSPRSATPVPVASFRFRVRQGR